MIDIIIAMAFEKHDGDPGELKEPKIFCSIRSVACNEWT